MILSTLVWNIFYNKIKRKAKNIRKMNKKLLKIEYKNTYTILLLLICYFT